MFWVTSLDQKFLAKQRLGRSSDAFDRVPLRIRSITWRIPCTRASLYIWALWFHDRFGSLSHQRLGQGGQTTIHDLDIGQGRTRQNLGREMHHDKVCISIVNYYKLSAQRIDILSDPFMSSMPRARPTRRCTNKTAELACNGNGIFQIHRSNFL